jgi:hypothetical protein
MSVYPKPKENDGSLNTVFNRDDYIKTSNTSSGTTVIQNDARYLKNSGVVVSSAITTFNAGVNFNSLATIENLTVNSLMKTKQSTDTLIISAFSAAQIYNFSNGMVYDLISDATVMTTLSFTDIPITSQQSYIFTYILQPSTPNSGYYIKPNTNFINVNGSSVSLYGLQNISLPAAYIYLVQQITIINRSTTTTPSFIALTSISAY